MTSGGIRSVIFTKRGCELPINETYFFTIHKREFLNFYDRYQVYFCFLWFKDKKKKKSPKRTKRKK